MKRSGGHELVQQPSAARASTVAQQVARDGEPACARQLCKRGLQLLGNRVTQWTTVSKNSRFTTKPSCDFVFATRWSMHHCARWRGHGRRCAATPATEGPKQRTKRDDRDLRANVLWRGAKRSPTVHYRMLPATMAKPRDGITVPAS
jgi:hypothetical protein